VAGGIVLRWGASIEYLRETFAVMFAVAGTARFLSAAMLAQQTETKAMWQAPMGATPSKPFAWPAASKQLVLYLVCVQVAVYVSGPYFTPYMLKELHLSYLQYMLLLGTAFVGKIVALPWFGAYAKRAGARRLLWIGGIGIIPVAGWWLFSRQFSYLLVVQVFSGIVWAAYELAMMLLFFEAIPRSQRVRVLTLYNFGNSAAMAGGAFIGAAIIRWFGEGSSTYLILFAVSSLGRAATLVLLPGAAQKVLDAAPLEVRTFSVRTNLPAPAEAVEKCHEHTAA